MTSQIVIKWQNDLILGGARSQPSRELSVNTPALSASKI